MHHFLAPLISANVWASQEFTLHCHIHLPWLGVWVARGHSESLVYCVHCVCHYHHSLHNYSSWGKKKKKNRNNESKYFKMVVDWGTIYTYIFLFFSVFFYPFAPFVYTQRALATSNKETVEINSVYQNIKVCVHKHLKLIKFEYYWHVSFFADCHLLVR